MKKNTKRNLLSWLLASFVICVHAQEIVFDSPIYKELYLQKNNKFVAKTSVDLRERPDHVNNMEQKFFPPVFNQSGGSCGAAGIIGYHFTYEWNCMHNTDASDPANQFPTHWTHLLSYQNSERNDIVFGNGIPNVIDYGGRTYSEVFGEQDCEEELSGRMQGYDKWYRAMFHRAIDWVDFKQLDTPEGKEQFKNWLWNHNGDPDFYAGGIACIGVAISNTKVGNIAHTSSNKEIGVAGKQYVESWGPEFDHCITIVGYDDRIEFDLDGDGIYGEEEEEEKGAWLICNSWGEWWANGGMIYCPYKYSYSAGRDIIPMKPSTFILRNNYTPERTFKITMAYDHRAELQLLAGVSEDLNADYPSETVIMAQFNYDGNINQKHPVPECPLLGKWADGKLHYEAMEFGYDVTDLTGKVDKGNDLKYFLIINTLKDAIGKGFVESLEYIDYKNESNNIKAIAEKVEIKNQGETTVVSFVVPGNGFKRPIMEDIESGELHWKAPETAYTIDKYFIYKNEALVDSVPSNKTSYSLPSMNEEVFYQVAAKYIAAGGETIISQLSDFVCPVLNKQTKSVTLSCNLDGTFIRFIRDYINDGELSHIDISNAHIVSGGEAYYENYRTSDDIISDCMFYRCKNLKNIILPPDIKNLQYNAFCESGLVEIDIPDNVLTLDYGSIANCPNLKKVTIGKNVTEVSWYCFFGDEIENVYVKAMNPPAIYDAFTSPTTIHVYPEALDAYLDSEWARYGTILGDLEPDAEEIKTIKRDENNKSSIYNLFGVKQSMDKKEGIYIIDGKKVLY